MPGRFWYIPRCRYPEFRQKLVSMATDRQWRLGVIGLNHSAPCPRSYYTCDDAHSLCRLGFRGLSYLLPSQHDPDSGKMWNPLYLMSGRRRSPLRAETYYHGSVQGAPCEPLVRAPCRFVCRTKASRSWACSNASNGAAKASKCCDCNRPKITLREGDPLFSGISQLADFDQVIPVKKSKERGGGGGKVRGKGKSAAKKCSVVL